MTETEKIDLLARMYNDVMYFALICLPHHFYLKPPEFHIEILDMLKKDDQYNCIVAPRGFAKSTLISLAYTMHQALFKKANYIVILSDTATQSERFLDTIRGEFESNDMIKYLFGKMEGRKWTGSVLELNIGTRIEALGSGGKVRGIKYNQYRPDLFIIDDLENDEAVLNKDRRNDLEDWYLKAVVPTLADNGRIVIIGTILHYDSLLNKLSKNPMYSRLFYRAMNDGKSLWEEKKTYAQLCAIKEGYKSQGKLDGFMSEYQNDPINDENATFKQVWFKYYQDKDVDARFLTKVMAVDLAISQKDTADYTVVMVLGMDYKNEVYILDYDRRRMTAIETIESIFKLGKTWGINKLGIESVAYQKSLSQFVAEEMKRRNQFMMIEDIRPDGDKERRIKGILQPRYAISSIWHKAEMTDLEEELLRFPKSKHDDIIDALAMGIGMLSTGRKTSSNFEFRSGRGFTEDKLTIANF